MLGSIVAAERAERDARQPDTATASLVSNRPLDQPTSFDRHTFRGDLPPGWDVTLYYNDALVGYQTPRADGQYAFDDLPLSFGPNEFRLVFNGPLGQVRVERQSFLLDQSVIAPGEIFYSLAQQRADNGDERTVAQVDYGLTRTLSAERAPSCASPASPRRRRPRATRQVGLRAYLDSMILSSQLTEEAGPRHARSSWRSRRALGGYSLDFTTCSARAASTATSWSMPADRPALSRHGARQRRPADRRAAAADDRGRGRARRAIADGDQRLDAGRPRLDDRARHGDLQQLRLVRADGDHDRATGRCSSAGACSTSA